jgi:hypothetical protein
MVKGLVAGSRTPEHIARRLKISETVLKQHYPEELKYGREEIEDRILLQALSDGLNGDKNDRRLIARELDVFKTRGRSHTARAQQVVNGPDAEPGVRRDLIGKDHWIDTYPSGKRVMHHNGNRIDSDEKGRFLVRMNLGEPSGQAEFRRRNPIVKRTKFLFKPATRGERPKPTEVTYYEGPEGEILTLEEARARGYKGD